MYETAEDNTNYRKSCEYLNERRDVFKYHVLINRIHKRKSVGILTETQYIEMYERMQNKQTDAYN